jgi:ElaB/YqjD/DUF883 family membrane-anchored ribosome-binding protein
MPVESFETLETQMHAVVRTVRDAAERAGASVQEGVADFLDRVHDLTREADGWVGEVREFVRTHPLQALAATVGIGFIVGKMIQIRTSRPA